MNTRIIDELRPPAVSSLPPRPPLSDANLPGCGAVPGGAQRVAFRRGRAKGRVAIAAWPGEEWEVGRRSDPGTARGPRRTTSRGRRTECIPTASAPCRRPTPPPPPQIYRQPRTRQPSRKKTSVWKPARAGGFLVLGDVLELEPADADLLDFQVVAGRGRRCGRGGTGNGRRRSHGKNQGDHVTSSWQISDSGVEGEVSPGAFVSTLGASLPDSLRGRNRWASFGGNRPRPFCSRACRRK